METTTEDIQRFVDPKLHMLIPTLLTSGIDRETLEKAIAQLLQHPADSPEIDVARMNLIGGLRAAGYVVTGGRGGGHIYKIVGWAEKPQLLDASQWVGRAREVLDWFDTLPRVTLDSQNEITRQMSHLPDTHEAHENCFPYLWCYELARDEGRIYSSQGQLRAVIIKKFSSTPRFRIFNLTLPPYDLLALAESLSHASLGNVTIINCTESMISQLKSLDPRGSILVRSEAVYNCTEIISRPQEFFGHQGFKAVKRNQRDTELVQIADFFKTDAETWALTGVVNIWRKYLESRHRQLAITRDYRAFEGGFHGLTFLGVRGNLPVGAYCLSPLPNCSYTASDIAHKGLNYTKMPGGRPGTSDWMLYEVCRKLIEVGIGFIQAGAYEGGGAGLPAYKGKFTDHVFDSKTFQTSFQPIAKSSITVENTQRNQEDNVSRVEIAE